MISNTLKSLHRFFASQSFYSLVLSTILSVVFFLGRAWRSESLVFSNLVWNLGLAWVPYLASLLAASLFLLAPKQRLLQTLPGVLWLIFFPNAPYIITDFLHLRPRPSIPLWYDILMLAAFAWTGLFLAIASLRTFQTIAKHHLGWILSWVFTAIALLSGGLGIYLGRFSRFNSWDLFFNPLEVVLDVASRFLDPLNNLRFFGFTFLFAAFLLMVYLTFVSLHRSDRAEGLWPQIDLL
jgi:uncharacterized membrane protein